MTTPQPINPPADGTPVQHWHDQWQHALEESQHPVWQGDLRPPAPANPLRVRQLLSFGTWPTVLLDTILLFLCQLALTIPVVLATIGLFLANGHHLSGSKADTDALTNWLSSPESLAADALATQLAIVLILQLRVVGRGLLTWAELGLGAALRRDAGRALATGVGLGLVAFVLGEVLLGLMSATGFDVNGQDQALKSVHHAGVLPFLLFALTAALTAPLAEETFFRGYALRALSVRYGLPVGLLISSTLFGLLHLVGGVGWVALPLVAVGAVLGWGYARTGNLLTNVSAHALNNAIGLILLYNSPLK